MTNKLKRLIKEELTCIQQDAQDALRDSSEVAGKLDCMRKHIDVIEQEIAYEAKSQTKEQVSA